MSVDTTVEIQSIFEKNKLEDLKTFINKRKCLNSCNMTLIYLFHIIQAAGILTTTIIWVGVGFNLLASLLNVFEKTNSSISKGLLKDIQSIKEGTFVDEGTIELPTKESSKGTTKEPLLADKE